MDFLSLPDEMIAGVMKYREFTYVFQLRRVNTRINCVAKKFKLGTKVPVREMEISVVRNESSGLTFCQLGLQLREDVIQYFNFERREDDFYYYFVDANADLSILEELLNNIESPRKLSLIKFPHQINRNFIQLFQKYRKSFRHCAQLTITEVDFVCSKEECKQFFLFFPELQSLYLSSRRGADIYCDSEVFENRPWDSISLYFGDSSNDFKCTTLDDEFLLKVAKNCQECRIQFLNEGYTLFTLDGAIKMVETIIRERITPVRIYIESVYAKDTMFEDAEERIRAIHNGLVCEFGCYSYSSNDGTNRLITKNYSRISFPTEPQTVVIEFNMCHIAPMPPVDAEPVDE